MHALLRRGLVPVALASAAVQAQPPPDPVAGLAWLAGCWAAEGRDAGSGEHWLAPAGGAMFGISRTLKRGKLVEFEFMQLRADEHGRAVFIALPSGQRETRFVQSGRSDQAVTFENPQHDFPQRVIYRLLPGGRLLARIEGQRAGGAIKGMDFPMQRVACDAPVVPAR